MRHALARGAVVALALVGGAGLGEAGWQGTVQANSTSAPPDWALDPSQVPYRLSELSGPLRWAPDAWSLDYWRAIRPAKGQNLGPVALSATVLLPEGGQIELWPASDPGERGDAGVALLLERVGAPSSRLVQAGRGNRRPLTCSGALPPPGADPVPVAVAPTDEGVSATVGGVTVYCKASVRGGGPEIRPGLRRVQISDLHVAGTAVAPPGPSDRGAWRAVGALLAALLVAVELSGGARAALVALTTAPLLLAWALAPLDLRLWAETARVAWLPVPWLAAGAPALFTALAKGTHHLGRALSDGRRGAAADWPGAAVIAAGLPVVLASPYLPDPVPVGVLGTAALGTMAGLGMGLAVALRRMGSHRPRRVAALVTATGCAAGCAAMATQPLGAAAILGAVIAGSAFALLLWANVNAVRLRRVNALSLACVTVGLLALELLARSSALGAAWGGGGGRLAPDDIFGWVPQAQEEFAALKAAQPTKYPDSGYPVAIEAPDGRPRIVAMGGSTTGGAFQNDDLRQFYPAQLGQLLGEGVAVLNQGVGGWTTWHIRRYLDARLDALVPDVLILYIGHNDQLTPVPMPYAELFAAWQAPGWAHTLGGLLGRVRLYQGLRYAVTAFGADEHHVAVPLADAADNLHHIIAAVHGRGGRVLLASEGLAPDPGPLQPYNDQLAAIAKAEPGTVYVDTASLLHALDGPPIFLDDCHLTGVGHGQLAAALAETLRREDMIPAHGAP